MTITKTFCDFCKKEIPNVPYVIDVKHVYGEPVALRSFNTDEYLLDFHLDCCGACISNLVLKYGKGGAPYDTETY